MKAANGKTDVVPDVSMSARKGAWIILSVLFSLKAATFVVVYLGFWPSHLVSWDSSFTAAAGDTTNRRR